MYAALTLTVCGVSGIIAGQGAGGGFTSCAFILQRNSQGLFAAVAVLADLERSGSP